MRATRKPSPPARLAPVTLVSAACLLLSACEAVRRVAETPGKVTHAVLPGEKPAERPSLSQLPGAVLQYADVAAWRIASATRAFAAAAGTPEAHIQALEWRLELTQTVIQVATGPMPAAAMLQMLVMATLGRINHEGHWMPRVWGEADRPMITALEQAERDAWAILERFLDEAQIAEVQRLLVEWRARPADASGLVVPPSMTELLAALETGTGQSRGKLLGFLQLDPLAGLEPAARELALARQTVERTLFWAERLPRQTQDQIELAALRMRQQPELQRVLGDVERTSLALQEFSETFARIPEELSAEREAAVRQVSDELSAQRAGLVHDLETARAPLDALLAQSRATFTAAEAMSVEVAGAVRALDAFVGRFDEEEDAAVAVPSAPEAGGKPFDITEYGAAAERIGVAAGELCALVNELDTSLPRMEALVETAAQRGERAIDHACWRGLGLGLALIAAAAGALLLVRRRSSAPR